MNRMEKSDIMNTLIDSKEEILATKRLFEIHQIDQSLSSDDSMILEGMIVKNFSYLTENGRISRDEYYALFQKCEAANDFAELALMTRNFLITRAQQYLAEHPEMPEDGDALNPGKGNIETAIMWNEAGISAVSEKTGKGQKTPIEEIGGPSLREIPDWVLAMKEEGLKMSEVYALLEEEIEEEPSPDVVVEEGVAQIAKKVDEI